MNTSHDHRPQEKKPTAPQPHVARVTATYSSTAKSRDFNAELRRTVEDVLTEAYDKLKEPRRADDMVVAYLDDDGKRSVDLRPYLTVPLAQLAAQGGVLRPDPQHRNQLLLDLGIEAQTGGA